MVLTLSLPVFADYKSESYTTEYAEYIGDVTLEEYFDFREQATTYRLPSLVDTRYFYNSADLTPKATASASSTQWIWWDKGSYTISPAGNDENKVMYPVINRGMGSNVAMQPQITVPAGMYYDFSANVDYPVSEYSSLYVGGTVTSYLYVSSDTQNMLYVTGVCPRVFPEYVQLLVNGVPVGTQFQHGSSGATLDETIEITEDVTTLGYRFFFNSANSGTASTTTYGRTLYGCVYVNDVTEFEVPEAPEEDPNTGLLQSLLDWIIGIYNSVFVPDSQKDDADAFQSEVSGTVTEADNVKTELDELEKPEPDEIDTDLSGIISDETYTQQTQIFVDLLKFEKITNMLMIVFTMALISYVLFGKKG